MTNNQQCEKHFSNRRSFFFNGLSIIFYFPLNILGQLNKSNFFMLKLQSKKLESADECEFDQKKAIKI